MVVVESAWIAGGTDGASGAGVEEQWDTRKLHLRGFVRGQGLSVNQVVTVPTAGDFVLEKILLAESATDKLGREAAR